MTSNNNLISEYIAGIAPIPPNLTALSQWQQSSQVAGVDAVRPGIDDPTPPLPPSFDLFEDTQMRLGRNATTIGHDTEGAKPD